jgi:sugar phosphate isomerase/epimerase
MPPAFSTCWNSSRHTDGGELVREILDLGFDTLELSHGMKVSLLPGILKAFESGGFSVCGLHNFCPSPVEVMIDAPDCYEFTSHKPYVRERALKLTRQTLEFAARFNARYVVLHLGSVAMRTHTPALEAMAAAGRLNDRGYVRRKLRFIREREARGPFYFQRAREAVARLADEAAEMSLVLAIESRSHYEQVPSEREMLALMEEFAGHPGVGYWHDFGHVQRKHNLSLLDHARWLAQMRPHLAGCHVHDVEWPHRDHRVPFMGDMELEKLLGLVPPGLPMVWELSSSRRRVHIRRAREVWDARPAPSG